MGSKAQSLVPAGKSYFAPSKAPKKSKPKAPKKPAKKK